MLSAQPEPTKLESAPVLCVLAALGSMRHSSASVLWVCRAATGPHRAAVEQCDVIAHTMGHIAQKSLSTKKKIGLKSACTLIMALPIACHGSPHPEPYRWKAEPQRCWEFCIPTAKPLHMTPRSSGKGSLAYSIPLQSGWASYESEQYGPLWCRLHRSRLSPQPLLTVTYKVFPICQAYAKSVVDL